MLAFDALNRWNKERRGVGTGLAVEGGRRDHHGARVCREHAAVQRATGAGVVEPAARMIMA